MGAFAAGVLFLGLSVWIATRVRSALLPMRVVRDRNRGAACLMVAIAGIGMFGAFLFLAHHLQQVLAFTPLMTGVAFLPMVLPQARCIGPPFIRHREFRAARHLCP